jgi:peptidoglycan biosynthesis protein MviN/MurJ (putative lipid II flippase)
LRCWYRNGDTGTSMMIAFVHFTVNMWSKCSMQPVVHGPYCVRLLNYSYWLTILPLYMMLHPRRQSSPCEKFG